MKYVKKRFKKDDKRVLKKVPHAIELEFEDKLWFVTGKRLNVNSEVIDWCTEQYGKPFFWDKNGNMAWAFYLPHTEGYVKSRPPTFYFNNEDDAIMFKTAWSGVAGEGKREYSKLSSRKPGRYRRRGKF